MPIDCYARALDYPAITGSNGNLQIVETTQPVSSRPHQNTVANACIERASEQRVSALIGSANYRALSDDTLKDEDNAAWVLSLPSDVKHMWLDRIHWIRLVDRLAENERFEPQAQRFRSFLNAWRVLFTQGIVDPASPFARELSSIRTLWLTPANGGSRHPDIGAVDAATQHSIGAWNAYLNALDDYHVPDLHISTLQEHDTMLWRLSGHIFQLIPFLAPDSWGPAGEFGRLDQFFNNLRDMQEDADRGICYLPADVLSRFGVTRGQVISGRCVGEPGHAKMMQYWLEEHLPTLYARAAPFIAASNLHPSLELMKTWSLKRYERITKVFCATGYDHRRFPARYWAEVRRDLYGKWRQPAPSQPA